MTKRIILALFSGLLLFTACYDDTEILNRLDELEGSTVTSINAQIDAIKASITDLENMDASLKSTIKTLESDNSTNKADISALKAYDESIEGKIKDLKVYVLEKASEVIEWSQSTFSTIEQYDAIVNDIDGIKKIIDGLPEKIEGLSTEIDTKIEACTASIKGWVNEALKAYYTSEEIDARLKALSDKLDKISESIENLMARIQSVVYVPDFEDGAITVSYGRNSEGLTYELNAASWRIRPADAAAKLAAKKDNLALQAVYTQTRASGNDVSLAIDAVMAQDDILTILFSGSELKKGFFEGKEKASVCLVISDGNNDLTSEYVPLLAVQAVSITMPDKITLAYGATQKIEAEVYPAGTKLNWSSSDETVAKVDENGNVTGIEEGTAIISATAAGSNKTARCTVIVLPPVRVNSISLNKTEGTLVVGKRDTLKVTFNPENATNKGLSWMTTDDKVITVSEGIVTAVGAGTASAIAVSKDGSKTASCAYTVTSEAVETVVAVESVNLDLATANVQVGSTITLTANVLPENATNKSVTWSSSDATIASVEDGKVNGVKAGSAVITVTTTDGGKTASCAITVSEAATESEYVDLGLSVKWAKQNIGASAPEKEGFYLAWGSTISQTSYDETSYNDLAVAERYNDTDRVGILSSADDVAKVKLGADWRIPTSSEWQELIDNCDIKYDSAKNVYVLTSKKEGYTEASIVLPGANIKNGSSTDPKKAGYAYYWASNIFYGESGYRWDMGFCLMLQPSGTIGIMGNNRYYGLSVRPVYDPVPVTE